MTNQLSINMQVKIWTYSVDLEGFDMKITTKATPLILKPFKNNANNSSTIFRSINESLFEWF